MLGDGLEARPQVQRFAIAPEAHRDATSGPKHAAHLAQGLLILAPDAVDRHGDVEPLGWPGQLEHRAEPRVGVGVALTGDLEKRR
jgi:hypothetical protein